MKTLARFALPFWLTLWSAPLVTYSANIAAASQPADSPAIVGKWKLVSVEKKGKTQTPGKLGLTWQIEEDSIRIQLASYSPTKHECVIDESKKPHHLSWTLRSGKRSATTNAIYEFDGKRLRVCTIIASEDRPTSFETTGEDRKNHVVFTFERDETPSAQQERD